MRRTPNPDTPAGRRILDVASELFYARGIQAVGVDLIADEAQTTKKTVYDRFGSKAELVAAYLTRREERWRAFLDTWLAEHAPARGVDRVLAVLDAHEAWWDGQRRGCAYVNAHAELPADHPGRTVLRANKAGSRELLVDLVREAGLPDPEALGTRVHVLLEGAMVAQAVGGLDDAFDHARAAVRALLG